MWALKSSPSSLVVMQNSFEFLASLDAQHPMPLEITGCDRSVKTFQGEVGTVIYMPPQISIWMMNQLSWMIMFLTILKHIVRLSAIFRNIGQVFMYGHFWETFVKVLWDLKRYSLVSGIMIFERNAYHNKWLCRVLCSIVILRLYYSIRGDNAVSFCCEHRDYCSFAAFQNLRSRLWAKQQQNIF